LIPGRRAGWFWFGWLVLIVLGMGVLEPIASSFEGDDLGVVEEPVEDGGGAWHVADELAPIFEWSVACHDGASGLVAPHDDLEEVFPAVLGELLHAHVIDDEEIGSEVAGERGVVVFDRFFVEEVADDIEDGSVEHGSALLDGGVADGLGDVGLAGSWWSHEENVACVVEELAGGEFEEVSSWDAGVEVPVELIDGLQVSELRKLGTSFKLAVIANSELVLEDKLKELEVAQSAGLSFVESDIE
jgi:hypothetical protein